MKPGSKFAAFLSKGATLIVPASMPAGRSRAMVVAGLVGFTFLASPAHAQSSVSPAGTAMAPRIVAPSTVPPYAQGVKGPEASAAMPARPIAAAPPAASPTRSSSSSQDWRNSQKTNQPSTQDRSERHRDREYRSAPLAAVIGAAIGLQQQTMPVAPGYGGPVYAPPAPYYDDGAPIVQGGYGPSYAPYPAPQVQQGGYQAGRAQPIPAEGRMLDPESAGKVMNLGGQAFDARDVFATVAAARVIGVDPSALFALESRAESAGQRFAQGAGGDNPLGEIAGPYAYATQRWLSAYERFAPAAGIPGAANAVIRGANGSLSIADDHQVSDILAKRQDRYISSLLAAAEMKSNDIRYRQTFGGGPTMAELVVGHHAGPEAMLRYAQIMRQSPDAPLASVMRANYARDLLVLTGMADLQPDVRSWTIGSFQARLDNALKNGLARFAMAKAVELPPDYRPGYSAEAPAAAGPRM
ncbi:hypothetical protein ACVIGB_000905 [Bradyrhizobium sp. USDA 4341]